MILDAFQRGSFMQEYMSMIGKSLVHYEISNQLGKGGMAVVYKAKATIPGRDVAIRKEKEFRYEHVFTFAKCEHALKEKEPVRKRKGLAPVGKSVVNVRRAIKSALERAGIEDFKFHDLRHTFASHMIMRGASLKEVQEILGHKTMTMTLRYIHLSQESKILQ